MELRFRRRLLAFTRDQRTRELDLASAGLAGRLIEPHVLDATGFDPWRRLVGKPAQRLLLLRPIGTVGTGPDGPAAVYISFDGGESIWVVAANYLDDVEGLDEADRLEPHGDEIIVIDREDVADPLGITTWPSLGELSDDLGGPDRADDRPGLPQKVGAPPMAWAVR